MREVLEPVLSWMGEGKRVAVATVVEVIQKAPRDPGSAMAVCEDGRVAGSVSGGCVEPAVIEVAMEVLEQGTPRLITFGISDEQAFEVGLSCGGTIHVWVEPLQDRETVALLQQAVREGRAVAQVTVLGSRGGPEVLPGTRLLVPEDPDQPVRGTTGHPALDARVASEARRMLAQDATARCAVDGLDVFVQSFAPPPRFFMIGAVHPAGALAAVAKLVGFRVIVVDPRSPFATPERLPAADEIHRSWPDDVLSRARLTPRDAVCVLTHDLKFDVPAILAALRSPVGYIGVMGSQRTHARRVAALREAGVTEEQLARLHAPIGLPIGARTPEELAIAIVAEVIAVRRRGTARPAAAAAAAS